MRRLSLLAWLLVFATLPWFVPSLAAATELRVGVETNYPPFSSLGPEGKPYGFDVDITAALCEAMKVRCVVQPMLFDQLIPAVETGKLDMVVASMSNTAQRRKHIDFSEPYYRSRNVAIGRQGDKFVGEAAWLAGKTIIVQRATVQENVARTLAHPTTTITTADTFKDAGQRLATTPGGILFGDALTAFAFLSSPEGKGFEITGELPIRGDYRHGASIGVGKNNPALRKRLNEAIQTIRLNGAYRRVNDKYFPFDIY